MKYVTHEPTEEHLRYIASNMRLDDAREVFRSSGEGPYESLRVSVEVSRPHCWTVTDEEGVPICVTGVAELDANIGVPWLLGTSNLEFVTDRDFMRCSKLILQRMESLYTRLLNFVDRDNKVAQRWLTWLGFEFRETVPYGPQGLPFIRFEKTSNV